MTFDPDNANVKRLKARHPDNWQQIMAQSQGLSDAAQARAIKKAQSACSPCAMPNSPTNKKHMTGASPAVLEADEKSEEIGKPETVETEHDKSIVSGKLARAFGKKVAFEWPSPEAWAGKPRAPELSDPRSGLTSSGGNIDIERAMTLPPTTTKQDRWPGVNPVLEGGTRLLEGAAYPVTGGLKTLTETAGWLADAARQRGNHWQASNSSAARDAVANLGKPDPAAVLNASLGPADAGGSASSESVAAPAAAGAKADGGKGGINPLLLAGGIGLGGAGLYGLYHYLNSKPKKKREEEAAVA
jgi:hypothetical protein